MSRPNTPSYKTLNWPEYNTALKRRGSLTIWFDPGMEWVAKLTGTRGRQHIYRDAALQTCLTMKVLFGMAHRQTTGFVESLLRLVGLDRNVPDFSMFGRREKTLAVKIPHRGAKGPLDFLIDSTGIKADGEGEWSEEDLKMIRGSFSRRTRKHGGPKRRVGRKIRLGIDAETLEIRAVEVTSGDLGDAPMLPELRAKVPVDQDVASVTAGACDTRKCHDDRRTRCPCRDPATQERQALQDRNGRRGRA